MGGNTLWNDVQSTRKVKPKTRQSISPEAIIGRFKILLALIFSSQKKTHWPEAARRPGDPHNPLHPSRQQYRELRNRAVPFGSSRHRGR